ncbi:MAG: excisionase family DNA-binding protein [Treponema sp.]|nr:excisionase family DNA-binding protein [Treponema sp.]
MTGEAMRYTAKEAAEKLGYSYHYFLKLVRDGRVQYHRISARRIYFDDDDLKATVEGVLVKKSN